MYTNILIPTDGSELSAKAVQHGVALAKRIGARVTALTALPPYRLLTTDIPMLGDTPDQYQARMRDQSSFALGAVARAAKELGVACELVRVEDEDPYRAIIDTAESNGCDLIVMASHGRRGVSALLLGSETTRVLVHCDVPVLVVK